MKYFIFLVIMTTFYSCKGSGTSSDGESLISAGAISDSQIASEEIQTLNEQLGSDAKYQLTLDELDLLKSEGAISDEQYAELKTLIVNS